MGDKGHVFQGGLSADVSLQFRGDAPTDLPSNPSLLRGHTEALVSGRNQTPSTAGHCQLSLSICS